jgi:hypothetical protein
MTRKALLASTAAIATDDDQVGGDEAHDALVPDPQVGREFGISAMTLWRWDHDPVMAELGWPSPVKIRRRNYRPRRALGRFKQNMMRRAIAARMPHSAREVGNHV